MPCSQLAKRLLNDFNEQRAQNVEAHKDVSTLQDYGDGKAARLGSTCTYIDRVQQLN